jgi:hypothetical protein
MADRRGKQTNSLVVCRKKRKITKEMYAGSMQEEAVNRDSWRSMQEEAVNRDSRELLWS